MPHGAAGEVVVRGPNVFFEYWGNAAATAEALRDGWYFTGDIGTRDLDGYFSIHDRKKNMIISGGENIYPAEVERVLHEHPAVAEAAVIGRPDAKWQEVPVAYVVRRAGATASPARSTTCAWPQLARFKVPREIVFVDACRATRSARCSISCSGNDRGGSRRAQADRERELMRIAVLGGGNGSFAAAGDFTLAGHEARLWRRDRAAVEAHRAAGGDRRVKDFSGRHEAQPRSITDDIGEAVRGAELILCPTPATAQADIAKRSRRISPTARSCSCRPAPSARCCSPRPRTMPAIAPRSRSRRPAPCHGSRASTGRSRPRSRCAPSGCRPASSRSRRKDHALACIGPPFPA